MTNLLKKTEHEAVYYFNKFIIGKRITILFYPEYPHKRTIIYKMLKHLNFNITDNPAHKSDLAFFWEDATYRKGQDILRKFNYRKILNLECADISKERISEIFEKTFGYGLSIDPTIYSGECLRKNNLNALHDGIIISCPVKKKEEGFVYQKVINNEASDGLVVDIRTPVMNGHIPFVYLKYKEMKDRFTNDLCKAELADVNEYLTKEETVKISDFCSDMGLDYCELDVLRNKDDGKIYIVDVNYTPWGPPAKLSEEDGRKAVTRLGDIFRKEYF